MLKTLDDALDYLYSFINLENSIGSRASKNNYNLNNIESILSLLKISLKNFKIIHIAGTKGKGSTTVITSKLLMDNGYRVLSFLSPHLLTPLERIQLDLKNISEDLFIKYSNHIKSTILDTKNDPCVKPTTFELFFTIFLLCAMELKPDYLVIETGLGGRLDTTNIVKPIASIITTIGMDHTEILGNTITKIAAEKAGIIKQNVPVISSKQNYSVTNILKKYAKQKCSPIIQSEKLFTILNKRYLNDGLEFSLKYKKWIRSFKLPLFGDHQIHNLITSLASLSVIIPESIEKIFNVYDKKPYILEISFPGRFTVLNKTKPIIVDAAHNKDSARSLVSTLNKHFKNIKKWTFLSGMAKEKDYKTFYKSIGAISERIIITAIDSYKTSNHENIYNFISKRYKSECIVDQKQAFDYIFKIDTPLVITGSFYLCGPFIDYYNKNIIVTDFNE